METDSKEKKRHPDETPLSELGLSARAYNSLSRRGYHEVGDLKGCTLEDMKKIPNMGEKSLKEVARKVAPFGVRFCSK